MLSILLKQSKQNYYEQHFASDWNNMENTWKGIKSLITIENITSSVLRTVPQDDKTITDPYDIAKYFSSDAETTKQIIKYSQKHFPDYLKHQYNGSIFIQPTISEEITTVNLLSTRINLVEQTVSLTEY